MKTVSLKCVYVGTREIDKRSLIEQFRHTIVLLTKRQLLSLLQAEKYLKATTSIYYYDYISNCQHLPEIIQFL